MSANILIKEFFKEFIKVVFFERLTWRSLSLFTMAKVKFTILILLSVLLFFLDIALGSVWIPVRAVVDILTQHTSENPAWQTIIWDFRLPRVLAAVLVGGGLSVSGLLMQTLFRNPIAGPYVLGISSGASLGVAILLMSASSISAMAMTSPLAMAAVSALGALAVLMLMLSIAWRVRDVVTLLIVGLMLGSATSAIVTILEYFSGLQQLKLFVLWSFGSLTRVTWSELSILAMVCVLGLSGSFFLTKSLNALLIGEDYARSMGLRVMPVRFAIILIAALLAGCITAFCGPVAFIGIATPHLARMFFQTQNHKILVPATLIIGVGIMLFCDMISQLPGSAQQLPINAVTSLFGAPVVIWIVIRGR